MIEFIIQPLAAFILYAVLSALLLHLGHALSANNHPERPVEDSIYASGEHAPGGYAAPGYNAFTQVALFFAVLHLGVLILATGGPTLISGLYLLVLMGILLVLLTGEKGQAHDHHA